MVEAIEHQSSLNSLLVDALPYIDHGYDEPGVREAVRAILLILKTKSASVFQQYACHVSSPVTLQYFIMLVAP